MSNIHLPFQLYRHYRFRFTRIERMDCSKF